MLYDQLQKGHAEHCCPCESKAAYSNIKAVSATRDHMRDE